jgi:hypothetical protein
LKLINIDNNKLCSYTTIKLRRICQIEVKFGSAYRCKLFSASRSSIDDMSLISFSRWSTILLHLRQCQDWAVEQYQTSMR